MGKFDSILTWDRFRVFETATDSDTIHLQRILPPDRCNAGYLPSAGIIFFSTIKNADFVILTHSAARAFRNEDIMTGLVQNRRFL
jgi:hypothetical protein